MPNSNPQNIQQRQLQSQNQKQIQRLMMSPQMQQAIYLLQLPTLELASLIETELEQNPVIECLPEDNGDFNDSENSTIDDGEQDDDNLLKILAQLDENISENFHQKIDLKTLRTGLEEKYRTFVLESALQEPSLYEHLLHQAQETFQTSEELSLAEAIIGNFDANGYLHTPLKEIALLNHTDQQKLEQLLEAIQTFEPHGVGARDLQESLLLQLRAQNKQETLAAKIIEEHFEDLLHNRLPLIQKKLGYTLEKITDAIHSHISPLDLHPGTLFSKQPIQYIVPDIILKQEGDNFFATSNNEFIPQWRINTRYMQMLNDPATPNDAKEFIKQKTASANWLMHTLNQRGNTLERIMLFLSQKQREFFLSSNGKLVPLTMKTVADELELNESTIARAVANKYADTPRGTLPLRFFFSSAYAVDSGTELSANSIKTALMELVRKEDKQHPLSDEELSKKLKAQGIHCARRTIAKHRGTLNIGNAHQRRQY